MLQSSTRIHTASRVAALTLIAAAVLSACGGGGGDPGAVPPKSGTTVPTPPPGTGTGTGTTPVVTAETKVAVSMVDGSGNPVTTLTGGQSATLRATVRSPNGALAANTIVEFATASSGMVVFTPATGTALTDSNGVATISVKPASYESAGAVGISATSVVDGKTGTSGVNIAIGAAPLTLGTLSFSPAPTGTLPAFSTVALNIPVTSNGQPADSSAGLILSSTCVGDGKATLVKGGISKGVQQATYTNNGCTRGRDTITASIGNSIQSIGIDVGAANIGAIQFSGSSLAGTSIVLKGSGGEGRSESAQLSFRVVDQQGSGLSGVDVDFSATTNTGGLTVSPTRATTDANGVVATTVSSGTIPTPVRVSATATRNGMTISGLSDALSVSTGLPIQRSMSLSAEWVNIEGDSYDNEAVDVNILMADQYGNLVSDNTAVNFVTEGGGIGSSSLGGCLTIGGQCKVVLRSQEFRPTNGRVTVLAYAQGVENFTDLDGNGQYNAGEPFEDMGDPFLDVDWNGSYNAAVGDRPFPYNRSSYSSAGNSQWGLNYIRKSMEVTFSGSFADFSRQVCLPNQGCRDWASTDGEQGVISSCSPQTILVRVADRNNNPMPYDTVVEAIGNKVAVSAAAPGKIGSTNAIGGTLHSFTVTPDASCTPGTVTFQTKTPKGNITSFKFNVN